MTLLIIVIVIIAIIASCMEGCNGFVENVFGFLGGILVVIITPFWWAFIIWCLYKLCVFIGG